MSTSVDGLSILVVDTVSKMSTKVDSNSMFSTTKAMNKMSTGVDINTQK